MKTNRILIGATTSATASGAIAFGLALVSAPIAAFILPAAIGVLGAKLTLNH